MRADYHSELDQYTGPGNLSLWAEHVPVGLHAERMFHDHDYLELAFIMNGRARHIVGDAIAPVGKGDLLLIQPGVLHAYDSLEDFEIINVLYKRERIFMPTLDCGALPLFQTLFPEEGAVSSHLEMARPILHLTGGDFDAVLSLMKRIDLELRGVFPGRFYYALGIFMELVARLVRLGEYEEPDRRLRIFIGDVVALMNERYKDRLSVEELVKASRMSRRNFFRQFKQYMGCSPVEHLLGIRLQKAAELLLKTGRSINEIAFDCGFCDANFLCKRFRERYRTSPRRYRLSGGVLKA